MQKNASSQPESFERRRSIAVQTGQRGYSEKENTPGRTIISRPYQPAKGGKVVKGRATSTRRPKTTASSRQEGRIRIRSNSTLAKPIRYVLRATPTTAVPVTLPWRLRPFTKIPHLPQLDRICIEDPRYLRYCFIRSDLLERFY